MKSIKKVTIGFLAFSFMALNFIIGNSNQSNDTSQFSLQNLMALQASAAEATCLATSDDSCTINYGGFVGQSKSPMIYVP